MENSNQKVRVSLENANVFALLVCFRKLAEEQGFSKLHICEILEEAMSGDHNHLIYTLLNNMEVEDGM